MRRALVTGGAGFIGSAVVHHLVEDLNWSVLVVDKLTYAGNLASLNSVMGNSNFQFVQSDICDAGKMQEVFSRFDPEIVMHLAAESHVDRSIEGPGEFINTNVVGTYTLLKAALSHFRALDSRRASDFRFHHISTDEVYGALTDDGWFSEDTRYDPRSPYSATKAASDHLVRAWGHTYGLPILVSNCSNNYGPRQYPEKLIPLMIIKGLAGEPMPVYGNGQNVRDWLFVEDHARALAEIVQHGRIGETYNVGGAAERKNIDVVLAICEALDRLVPRQSGGPRRGLIARVEDRPGHDYRYAIDFTKLQTELGWSPRESFESGLMRTVRWYVENRDWWQTLLASHNPTVRRGLVA